MLRRSSLCTSDAKDSNSSRSERSRRWEMSLMARWCRTSHAMSSVSRGPHPATWASSSRRPTVRETRSPRTE